MLKLPRLQLSRLQYGYYHLIWFFQLPLSPSYFLHARNNDPVRTRRFDEKYGLTVIYARGRHSRSFFLSLCTLPLCVRRINTKEGRRTRVADSCNSIVDVPARAATSSSRSANFLAAPRSLGTRRRGAESVSARILV